MILWYVDNVMMTSTKFFFLDWIKLDNLDGSGTRLEVDTCQSILRNKYTIFYGLRIH